MSKNRVTATEVINHLREYGPNARVLLLIGGDEPDKVANDREKGPILGEIGIMTLYSDELSAISPTLQLTHKAGGVVRVMNALKSTSPGFTSGIMFSMVWAEGLSHLGTDALARSLAEMALRMPPQQWVESEEGFIVPNDTNPTVKV
jgi:hypothetical protein